MTPIVSTTIQTTDSLMTALATQQKELLVETIVNIKKFICGKYWYSACTLAAALSDEMHRQSMGYLIITRFLEEPVIDDHCLLCKWKMSCVNCQKLGARFFKKLSSIAFADSSNESSRIASNGCLQMVASIWPDTSSDWVYIAFQASLRSQKFIDALPLAVYFSDETLLRFVRYCSSLIPILVKEGRWNVARKIESIAASFAMAKGLPFTSPLYSKSTVKMT